MNHDPCPQPDLLVALCEGTLADDVQTQIVAHLDSCTKCQRTLDQVGSGALADEQLAEAMGIADLPDTLQVRLTQIKAQSPVVVQRGKTMLKDLTPWLENRDGQLWIDEFELVECLGRGGMGIVFHARDSKLGRDVALKMMSPAMLAIDSSRERFLREARAAARVNHANIVTIFAVVDASELPYLVMELVDGESLQDLLTRESDLPTASVLNIAKQIATGLLAAHECGIVHRDVKPANILIDRATGTVKLTDFGLARTLDESRLTQTGMLVGTPEFIAPEQLAPNSGTVDHRADLFSLGSILYLMCGGEKPFAGETVMQTVHEVCHSNPRPLRQLNPDTPVWLVSLISGLHEKHPEQRIATAAHVVAALESKSYSPSQLPAIVNKGELAATRPAATKTKRWTWWIAGSLLLLVAGTLVLAFSQPSSKPLGTEVTSSGELVELLSEPSFNGTIVLANNGPFLLPNLVLQDRQLRLTAKPGCVPVLGYQTTNRDSVLLIVENSVLNLEGLSIQETDLQPGSVDPELENVVLQCESGNVTLKNCRVKGAEFWSLFRCNGGTLEIEDSELFTRFDTGFIVEPFRDCEVLLQNNTVACATCFEVSTGIDSLIKVDSSTIIGHRFLSILEPDEHDHGVCEIQVANNVIDMHDTLVLLESDGFDIEDLPLRWHGTDNVLPERLVSEEGEDHEDDDDDEREDEFRLDDLDEIMELSWVTIVNSRQAVPNYTLGREELEDRFTDGELRARDLALPDDAIGAHIDEIGPMAATGK